MALRPNRVVVVYERYGVVVVGLGSTVVGVVSGVTCDERAGGRVRGLRWAMFRGLS